MKIVIPVFGAELGLNHCLHQFEQEGILAQNSLLFIVDDALSAQTKEKLQAWVAIHPNAKCTEVKSQNSGFFACANEAIKNTSEDIIFLDPSVNITINWLTHMVGCAEKLSHVAGIVPIINSNNNGCLPVIQQINITAPLPDSTSEDVAHLIEQGSSRDYPRLCVGNNYCFLLTKKVLNMIGGFDVDTYKNDSVIMLDFAYRAAMSGFSFYLCDDAYIHVHRNRLEENDDGLEPDMEKLIQTYPYLENKRRSLQEKERMEQIKGNIFLNTYFPYMMQNGKKNILYISHYDFRQDSVNHLGGVQLHLQDLVHSLKDDYNIFVAARDTECLRLTAYTEDIRMSFKYDIFPWTPYPIENDWELRKNLISIMNAFAIDMVHIQSIVELSFDIFDAAKQVGIPTILTLHDNYFICPNINLLDHNYHICARDNFASSCSLCMQNKKSLVRGEALIADWRRQNDNYLQMCDRIIAPSQSAADMYVGFFPSIAGRISIIEHGTDKAAGARDKTGSLPENIIPSSKVKYYIDSAEIDIGDMLAVEGWAYLEGTLGEDVDILLKLSDGDDCPLYSTKRVHRPDLTVIDEKYVYSGFKSSISLKDIDRSQSLQLTPLILFRDRMSAVLKPLIAQELPWPEEARKRKLRVAFVGGINYHKGSKEIIRLLQLMRDSDCIFYTFGSVDDENILKCSQPNLKIMGRYAREDIQYLLKLYGIDVVCILSILGETFCYTLSEAFLAGLPVITTDVGAQGQRVRDSGAGWIVSLEHISKDVQIILDRLINNPQELEAKRELVKMVSVKTVAEMAGEYHYLYNSFPSRNASSFSADIVRNEYQRAHTLSPNKIRLLDETNSLLEGKIKILKEELEILRSQRDDGLQKYKTVINSVSWKSTAVVRKILSLFQP